MKIARIIGLAVVTALALTVFAGAIPAQANTTVMCKSSAPSHYCSDSEQYSANTELKATSSEATISSSVFGFPITVTCAESALEGETSAQSGDPLPGAVSAWTLGGCELEAGEASYPCLATTENLPYAGSVAWTEGDDGTLAIGDGGEGQPGWHVVCTNPETQEDVFDCTYAFEPSLDFSGGSPGQLVASSEAITETGEECPANTAKFTAVYTVGSPEPVHVAKKLIKIKTVLCEEGGESPCPEGAESVAGTVLKAKSGNFTIDYTMQGDPLSVACKSSEFEGETTADRGKPLPIEISSWNLQECTVRDSEGQALTNCIGETQSLPYTGSVFAFENPAGDGFLGVAQPRWRFICSTFTTTYDCMYAAVEDAAVEGEMATEVVGGEPAEIRIDEFPLEEIEPEGAAGPCLPGSGHTLSGTFTLTPQPLFVMESLF